MQQIVLNGNNIEVLKKYPDNYFDSVVTDPPYGLGKEPDAAELMKDWVDHGYHEIKGSGFMGKEWDAFVPQPLFWKEVFRVLKHGGHVVSFFGTRTYDWGVMAMRFAGFEIRDQIAWCYGSGFPKSHNVEKAINKLDGVEFEEKPAEGVGFMKADSEDWNVTKNQLIQKGKSSERAKDWSGWGSALKPAIEPIVLARKPLEKGLSIAENVLKWGTGGINIDGCRIGYQKDDHLMKYEGYQNGKYKSEYDEGTSYKYGTQVQINPQGRFPANIILTHHPECECKGLKKVKGSSCKPEDVGKGRNESYNNGIYSDKKGIITISHNDENGQETVEDWNCHPDCPIKIMDEQSGLLKSGYIASHHKQKPRGKDGIILNNENYKKVPTTLQKMDSGGASRFFYCAKASKSERNKGLEEFEEKTMKGRDEGQDGRSVAYKPRPTPIANIHPTVKPVKLMQYLVRLITPPNGIVLDPFCGSGTTGIACKLEGFEFVGIEQDPEYCKIAQARVDNWVEEKEEKQIKEEKENPLPLTQTTLF